MLADFRFALRQLAKSPGFTAVAVVTLAVAIGVNTAAFSLVNGLALRPLVPLRPAEVVNVFTARAGASRDTRQFSLAEYLALREAKDVFADVAALNFALAGVGREEGVRRSFAFFTSENFLSLCGVAPARGRFYNAEECRPNANLPVVVVSHAFWQQLGGRPDLVGSTLQVNGRPYTVIGITPDGFSGLNAMIAPDLWLPLGVFEQFAVPFGGAVISDLADPKNYTLNVTARMAPGLTLDGLKARLPVVAKRLTALQPPDAAGERELLVEPPSRFSLSTTPSNDGSTVFLTSGLMGMAGCVLLLACLNLANLLLARGKARNREIAVRLALGATHGRIIRLLVAEGLVLALAGGSAGMLFSIWSNDLLLRSLGTLFSSMNFSLVMNARPDAAVLAVTFLFCLAATLMFSLGPALKSARLDVVHDLKQQGEDGMATGRWNRFFAPRQVLVMAQIGLSLMLLFCAGLFLRGALNAGGLRLGFEPAGGIVTELDFSLGNTRETDAKREMLAALDRVRALPGVSSVGLSTMLPYGNLTNATRVVPAATAPTARTTDLNAPDPSVGALYTSVTSGYFETIGARLLRGRDFTATESSDKGSPRVTIIDETLARKLFPKEEVLGQRIRYTHAPADGSPAEMEVVGIVASHRHGVLDGSKGEYLSRLFVPLAQNYSANVFLHARLVTRDRAATVAAVPAVRSALRSLNPDLPVMRILPFADVIDMNLGLWIVRIGAVFFGVFGGIALALAVVGVYGVKSYAVARRTREIGIRMALGAHPRDVFALIMKQGAYQIVVAVAAGVLLSLGAGRLLSHMLYQVSPADPVALGVTIVVLAASALLACFLPARRATKIDPLVALRTE
ncbi:MAG: ABC transporter permease [Opitutaceae bacterium]|nr:ABC transporter permease [Opitutaceae bacterium]